MFKNHLSLFILLLILHMTVYAEKPNWISKLPFTDDAFWGVGKGNTLEEAQNNAKKDILMQISSHVDAAITMEEKSNGGDYEVSEELDAYFESNTLRGAELEDQFEEDSDFWALMKYCDECGDMLINSALVRFEEQYDYDSEVILERLVTSNISEVLLVERRLKELKLEDYRSEDIVVSLTGKSLKIMIINFLPDEITLSQSQNSGLKILTSTLFEELKLLKYNQISIIGHANPTGLENEEEQLIELSRNRAETMSLFLENSGFTIDSVGWKGGDEAIGDVTTQEGMGLNKRVEIVIQFEEL